MRDEKELVYYNKVINKYLALGKTVEEAIKLADKITHLTQLRQ